MKLSQNSYQDAASHTSKTTSNTVFISQTVTMEAPHLACVILALSEQIIALSHVVHCIGEYLMPKTIDAAVYNDCQYVIQVHGATRRWTVEAMDVAAERGRFEILKWLSGV
ncbi:unnamed protein product [Phytophthora lilii]|uniref:Unnamed protein product n=1 Tax=Phytophthora lilii TaxID=2077276 RepID=A0A9W6U2U7_9STRA|nr:unnamed protein product [Phytophthora lilii]